MSQTTSLGLAFALATLATAPCMAENRSIESKAAGSKTAHVHALHAERSLADRIGRFLRNDDLPAGSVFMTMSPSMASRLSVVVGEDTTKITLIDARTATVIEQWTVDRKAPPSVTAPVYATVAKKMGLEVDESHIPPNKVVDRRNKTRADGN